MAALTWSTLQTSLIVMLAQGPSPYTVIPSDFAALYPQATSYAEGRIYRDLIPLNERTQNTSLTTTPASRVINLAAASHTILTVEGFGLITPAGTTVASAGNRVLFEPGSIDLINNCWPVESVTMDPALADWTGRYWTLLDDHTLVFCPTVPGTYTAVIIGTFAVTPISAANPSTYLSTTYSDLLQAACLVFLSGALLRNFGAQSDDPKMAMSWETQYKTLLESAILQEQRRRMQGVAWSQYAPAPLAKPDRP